MNATKYHIYIEYADEKEKPSMRFNLTLEELVRTFVTPFKSDKPFWFLGKLLKPPQVHKVIIFCSSEDASTLFLPNREAVAGHADKKFVMDKILAGKLKAVQVCTEKFLPINKLS